MPHHPLTLIKIHKYQNKPKFNGAYSKNKGWTTCNKF